MEAASRREFLAGAALSVPLAALVASDRASAITAAVTNVTCGELAD